MTGLLHVEGARSIGGWRNISGISSLEQHVEIHVPWLVDCRPGPPEEVFPQSRRASLETPQIVARSFDLASAMPLAMLVRAGVVGQRNKPHRHPASTFALTLGSQEPEFQADTVFHPLSATAAPSFEPTNDRRYSSHSLPITKLNLITSACKTIEDEVGTQEKSTKGLYNRQAEQDENDRGVEVLSNTQDTYAIYPEDDGRIHRNWGSGQRDAMNEEFYGVEELSMLHERHVSRGVKRKRVPSAAAVEASNILREELKGNTLCLDGMKSKGGLPRP